MKNKIQFVLAFMIVFALSSVGRAQTQRKGEVSRDFEVKDYQTGAPLRLSDFAGKIVLLDFFTYWCGWCVEPSSVLEREVQKYYADRGGNPSGVQVQVISVNCDQTNRRLTDTYIRNTGISFVVDDILGLVARQYGIGGYPSFILINGVSGSPGLKQWQILMGDSDFTPPGGFPPNGPFRDSAWCSSLIRPVIDAVKAPPTSAPTITAQPANQSVLPGKNAVVSVEASGWPAPTYQWRKDGIAIAGATTSSFAIAAATAGDSGNYSVIVRNSLSSVTSDIAVLKVASALVSPAAREVGSGRVVYQLMITSGENWTVTKDAPWVTVSRTSGSRDDNIEITVEANTGSTDRTATVRIGDNAHPITQRKSGTPTWDAWAVGSNTYGQLGDNRLLMRTVPANIAGNVKQVTAGTYHSLYLMNDGTLWATGSNSSGQLGDGVTTGRSTPGQIATGVHSVEAGGNHTLFLKTDGTLWATGSNTSGQLGNGSTSNRITPQQIATGVKAFATGSNHSLFVKTDGTLWAMGSNSYGQLGDGSTTNRSTPVQVASGVQSVAAGDYHSLFIKTDGTCWAMGLNSSGQLGDESTSNRITPVQVASNVQAAAGGATHSLFLKTDGTLWSFGYNYYGQLGEGSNGNRNRPGQIATGVQAVAAGANFSLFIKSNGSLWVAGYNRQGQLGDGTTNDASTPVQIATGVLTVAGGGNHSLFTKTDYSLWAMGSGYFGQLGDSSSHARTTPIQVVAGVQALAAGNGHSLFLKSDRSLWSAGANSAGQLGDGSTSPRSSLLQIGTDVQAVSAGYYHTLFVKADGSLFAMGENNYGQFGSGATTDSLTPLSVATGVRTVAAGYYHSLFVKTDGSLWAMGRNNYGQLGDGSTNDHSSPVQIITGVQSVAAGGYHSLFLKTDGSLWVMGYNTFGQLGDGSTSNRQAPVQITTGVQAIAAGLYHSLYVKTDGTLWSTGYNNNSQLGNGSATNQRNFVQIASGVRSVAAGYNNSLFIKSDGTLWAAGLNSSGQLGDGTTINRSTPIKIAGNASAAAAGGDFILYVTETAVSMSPPQIATQPVARSATSGGSVTFSVTASGDGPFSYQWRRDGTTLSGATAATFTLANVSAAQAGNYDVVITNAGGSVTSQAATLTLQSSRISNLSVRTSLDAGQSLTVGFVTSGSKRLLARAVGPSLYTVAGLTGFLPDPRLSLINQGTGAVVAQNDNWDASLSATCASLGAFPMDAGSKDCALLHPVSGPHTAQIAGVGSGIVLVEVYDAESTSAARLTNVSARNQVGTGDNILIAGFVIDGSGEKTLLIRAIGPALRDLWGVGGVLTDPKLEVYRQGGPKLAENDNWDSALAPVFDQVGAFKPLTGSKDAALRISLPPGAYTVQVSGVGNVTGDGLVELYELP